MRQEFKGAVEHVAARDINIHYKAMPCPGSDFCPYEKNEAERQRQFEEHTGITCSSGARVALQHLLDSGVFHYKQLALAHRQRTLLWDWDGHILNARESRLDVYYGVFMVIFGVLLFALAFGGLLFIRGKEPVTYDNLLIIGAGLLFLAITPFADKYLIRPSRIARRAKPILESFYALGGDAKKQTGS